MNPERNNTMQRRLLKTGTLLGTLLLSGAALAHSGHDAHGGLSAGLLHPLTGTDHLLVMLGVGLWAASRHGGRAALGLPAVFLACMALGIALGMAGVGLPGLEAGIAASVLVLGLLIAARLQLNTSLAVGIVAGAALLHGSAHGLEMPGSGRLAFVGGVLLASLGLHLTGLAAGRLLSRRPWLMRGVGLVTSVIGGGLLLTA
jgi:urease accessory protein